MKKTLISVLIFLLLVTVILIMLKSLRIGKLEVLGIKDLSEENKKLDTNIQALSRLSSIDFQQAVTDVTTSTKKYEQSKKEYEELTTFSTNSEISAANQLQKYDIEYLWTRIGNHATSENVVLKIEIKANSTSEATGYYNLNFEASGDYVGITDFIYDIENDSSLGFKIEGFKMEPNGDKLKATFTCTNIAINIDPSAIAVQQNKDENNDSQENVDRRNGPATEATEQMINNTTGNTTNSNTTNTTTNNNTTN